MSSSILITIENLLNVYGYAISMILGNIGNVFIIIIFYPQRKSACAIYLICSAVMNIVYLTYDGIATIVMFYYPDRTILVISFCKVYKYVLYIFGQEGKTMLALACIDRFLITSERASFRAFSTPKRAKYLIFLYYNWCLFSNLCCLYNSICWFSSIDHIGYIWLFNLS